MMLEDLKKLYSVMSRYRDKVEAQYVSEELPVAFQKLAGKSLATGIWMGKILEIIEQGERE